MNKCTFLNIIILMHRLIRDASIKRCTTIIIQSQIDDLVARRFLKSIFAHVLWKKLQLGSISTKILLTSDQNLLSWPGVSFSFNSTHLQRAAASQIRAVLHILRIQVAHFVSYVVSEGPQGPLKEMLATQEAIFQLRLLLNVNFPHHP